GGCFFHDRGTRIVVITGIKLPDVAEGLCVFVSEGEKSHVIPTPELAFSTPVNGTGDLFSALFLGSYLHQASATHALAFAVSSMHKVLQNTLAAQARELQVLSLRYDVSDAPTRAQMIEI
ncbi:MAG: hypothetical protein PHD48_09275, partial [Alphaproteobacteria bacterium]|nr:hypothetical protein [Alphaproteobacteria bacterium]